MRSRSLDYSCYDSLHPIVTYDLTSRAGRRDAPKARKDFQTRFAGDSTQGESLLVCGFNAQALSIRLQRAVRAKEHSPSLILSVTHATRIASRLPPCESITCPFIIRLHTAFCTFTQS